MFLKCPNQFLLSLCKANKTCLKINLKPLQGSAAPNKGNIHRRELENVSWGWGWGWRNKPNFKAELKASSTAVFSLDFHLLHWLWENAVIFDLQRDEREKNLMWFLDYVACKSFLCALFNILAHICTESWHEKQGPREPLLRGAEGNIDQRVSCFLWCYFDATTRGQEGNRGNWLVPIVHFITCLQNF